jgi:hypothetical protein
MWLITPIGFFSIVRKPADRKDQHLTVRARVRGDLVALRAACLPSLGPITQSDDTDYRYRARAPQADIAAAASRLLAGVDYGNFKSEVARRQGHARAEVYHDVWERLQRLQADPAFVDSQSDVDSEPAGRRRADAG